MTFYLVSADPRCKHTCYPHC